MFKNWFKKKERHVADLERIELAPEFFIDPKTRRELYEDAVAEVKAMRVSELIFRSLWEMMPDDEELDVPTLQALSKVLAKDYVS